SKLRRAVRSRGHFPGDEAAMKLLYLVLNNAAEPLRASQLRDPLTWVDKLRADDESREIAIETAH
ncbi:transposase, partial [Sinorhizobium meliloti]|uniref:transposase n=1 Tax=Rhizobium meliloti TaxID=382 RepID=UPI00399B094C